MWILAWQLQFFAILRSWNANKLFFPETALDFGIPDGHVELQGAELSLKPEGRTFLVEEGIHVTKEVTTGEDPQRICGPGLAEGAMLEKGARSTAVR